MGGMLTSIRDLSRYVSVFLDAWPPRDGQERGPIRRASLREMQQPWRPSTTRVTRDESTGAAQLDVGQLRVRPGRHADVRLQHGDCPQRRPARLRIADAMAAGLRRRHHRVREPDLHRLGACRGGCRRSPREDWRPSGARRSSHRRRWCRHGNPCRSWWSSGTTALRTRSPPSNLFLDRSKDRRRKELDELSHDRRQLRRARQVRLRRKRAPRSMDDELRAREAAGLDHAGADDAAERAVHGGACGAGRAGEGDDVRAVARL